MRIDIQKEDLTIDEAIDYLRQHLARLIDRRRVKDKADWKVANFRKNYGHVTKDGEWDHLSPQGIQDAIDTIKKNWADIPPWYERYIRCKAGCGEWVVVSDKSLALKEGVTCPRCKVKEGVPTSYKLHCRECQERFPLDDMVTVGVSHPIHYCSPCYWKLLKQEPDAPQVMESPCYYCNVVFPVKEMERVERNGGGHYVCDGCLCADCGTACPPPDANGICSWHNHPDELKALCWVCWERRQRPITCARCRTHAPGHDLHGQTWYAGLKGWKDKIICQKCFHFLTRDVWVGKIPVQ